MLVGLILALCLCLAACSERDQGERAGKGASVVHTYNLRGRIMALPDDADPASELRIHHEAIDDFKMGDGEPAPMKSMTMPFTLAPGESLEGFAVGDAVEFVFSMQWEPSHEMRVGSFKKLPDDTKLDFEVTGAEAGLEGHGEHGGQ